MPSDRAAPSARGGPLGLADLVGVWGLERWIDDHRAGQGIAVSGMAEIAPHGAGALYDERAEMHLPGQPPLTATRRYLLEGDGPALRFLFEDGRYFHVLDLAVPAPRCHHDCPPDSYDVAYDFAAWPEWRATWRVTGPRKDYTMTTTYRPA